LILLILYSLYISINGFHTHFRNHSRNRIRMHLHRKARIDNGEGPAATLALSPEEH